MKKFLSMLLAVALVLSLGVVAMAAEIPAGTETELKDAIASAAEGDTIKLTASFSVTAPITVNKSVTIDLNNNELQSTDYAFQNNASVNVTIQNGKISGGKGFLWFAGNLTLNNVTVTTTGRTVACYDSSVVTVGKGSTLTTTGEDAAIIVWGTKTDTVTLTPTLNVYGTVKCGETERAEDKNFATISTNGKDYSNPVINIYDGAVVSSGYSTAMYIPVCGSVNISGGTITGYSSAVAIKEGVLNISGGTLTATGPDKTPTQGFSNGIKASGAAIQVESNDAYKEDEGVDGTVVVNITGGEITSEQGAAIYEYVPDGSATDTHLTEMTISDGTVTGASGKQSLMTSEQADTKKATNITGGTYSTDVTKYVQDTNLAVATVGGNTYAVGAASIEAAVGNDPTKEVVVTKGNAELTGLPVGTKITNNGGGTVTANGEEVKKDNPVTIAAPTTTPTEPTKPVYRDTVTIEIGGEKTETEETKTETEANPNTGAPSFIGVAVAASVLALGGIVLSKRK